MNECIYNVYNTWLYAALPQTENKYTIFMYAA